jgi:hypothetical protein
LRWRCRGSARPFSFFEGWVGGNRDVLNAGRGFGFLWVVERGSDKVGEERLEAWMWWMKRLSN